MKRFFLNTLVKWFTGLTKDEFARIIGLVGKAAKDFSTSEDKTSYVNGAIRNTWPKLAGWMVNLLRELAVGLFKKGAV